MKISVRFFLLILQVIVCVRLEPIRVGRINDAAPIILQDSPLKHQAQRLETLRQKLIEQSRVREEELEDAARQYQGSKLFQESQRIISRLRNE
jgi:hypothetical protein